MSDPDAMNAPDFASCLDVQERLERARLRSVRLRFELHGQMERAKSLVWVSEHLIRPYKVPLTVWGPSWIAAAAPVSVPLVVADKLDIED